MALLSANFYDPNNILVIDLQNPDEEALTVFLRSEFHPYSQETRHYYSVGSWINRFQQWWCRRIMAKHIKKHFWNKRPSEGMKSAVAYTFASLFSKGLAFVTVPIFTRIMSTSEMGTVNLYNSWQSILTVVATLSLTYGGYMVALKEYEHERDRYESSVLTLTTFTSIVFFAVYSVAPNCWSRIFARKRKSGRRTIVRELCRAICCCSCAMGIHHGARAQVHFHAVLEILTCSECASYCESVRHADSE